ncbi:hypothetical protein Tco_0968505 [Tanacetum coccineum]
MSSSSNDFKMKRESCHVEEETKFLHDTNCSSKMFSCRTKSNWQSEQNPYKELSLGNQMMTYLKHVGNKKHSNLKSKTIEEIQALYEKVKRFDESFTAIGSTKDERRIKEMNEGLKDTDQKKLKEEDTAKVPAKVEVTKQGTKKRKWGHIKMIAKERQEKQSDLTVKLGIITDGSILLVYRANGTSEHSIFMELMYGILNRREMFKVIFMVDSTRLKIVIWDCMKLVEFAYMNLRMRQSSYVRLKKKIHLFQGFITMDA